MSLFKFVFSFCVSVSVCVLWFLFNGLRLFVIRDSFIASNMFHVLYFWLLFWHNKTQKQKKKETEPELKREREWLGERERGINLYSHSNSLDDGNCQKLWVFHLRFPFGIAIFYLQSRVLWVFFRMNVMQSYECPHSERVRSVCIEEKCFVIEIHSIVIHCDWMSECIQLVGINLNVFR